MKGSAFFSFTGIAFTAIIITLVFTFNSCDKVDTGEFVSQAEVVAEYVRAEDYTINMFGLMHSCIYDTALINNGEAIIDSVYITYQIDSISGIATFLYDFDSPNQPASTKYVYSGQVTAKLFEPFTNEGAVMKATFYNYMVTDYLLEGVIYYQNTGETIEGKQKYLLQYGVDMYLKNNILLAYNPARDLFWTDGFNTPADYKDDEFILTGGADATYYYPTYPESTVLINVTFTEDWTLGISCSSYFREGTFDAVLSPEEPIQPLNGVFLDADYDNCADKVMIKNSDGSLGYPYYL
jgi:hypothetical protein